MKISDLLLMCVRNLVRRKFRTFLTVTGVVIGTTSIVMMISLGIGISTQQEEQLKMWGDLTMIQVWSGGGNGQSALDDAAVKNIQAIDGVDVATPFARFRINSGVLLYAGKRFTYLSRGPQIYGIYPEALEKLGYKIDKGAALPEGKTKIMQIVFGGSSVYDFEDTRKKFNNRRYDWPDENGVIQPPFFDALSSNYKLVLPPESTGTGAKKLEYEIEVCGVLTGERNKYETVYGMFMSLEDMKKLTADFNKENGIKTPKSQKDSYDEVKVKALDMSKIPEIEKQIQEMGFGSWSMETQRQEMQKSMRQMQIILGGLGAISLLVSAISITNTMIMSVYERTREIGVMKVLGCLVGNIRSIFLLEAGFIGFFGGVLGVGLSFLLSFLLNVFGGALSNGGGMFGMFGYYGDQSVRISIIPTWLVLLGMVFATGIGLVAGFYPANRAVRISALEAIRQE